MKKIKSLPVLMLAAFTVFMSSCKKTAGPTTPVEHTLDSYFNDKQQLATQSFMVNTSENSIITGSKGTRITILTNAFTTMLGAPVSGNVTLKLMEAHSYKDMLHLNTQTLGIDGSEEKLLVSGGQIMLTATLDGVPLKPAPGRVKIEMPFSGTVDPEMQVFYGGMNEENNLEWTVSTSDSITITSDSLSSYYQFPIDDFGWINCDHFYGSSDPLTHATINLPAGHTAENSMVWMVFPSENAVLGVYTSTENTFTSPNIPVGINAIIVVLTKIDGSYESAFVPVTIADGHTENITLSSTTLTDFETNVDNL